MNECVKVLCAGIFGASLSLALAVTTATAAADPTEQRQAAMKAIGQAMKEGAALNSAKTPYDPAKAKAAMGSVSASAKKLHTLFPANSASAPKTAALPVLWTKKADFDRRLDELAKLADAAGNAKTAEAYKPAFLAVGATCKGCHDLYRKKAS